MLSLLVRIFFGPFVERRAKMNNNKYYIIINLITFSSEANKSQIVSLSIIIDTEIPKLFKTVQS